MEKNRLKTLTEKEKLVVNKIYCGDAIETLQSIVPDNSIDCIVTSPPYNIGIKYDSYDDNLPVEEYYLWCYQWMQECYRVLKPDGRMAVVHYLSMGNGEYRHSPIGELNSIALKIGFHHHAIALWADRTRKRCTAWGSWLSASSPYINSPYEAILFLYKETWKKQRKGISTITKEEFIEACGGIWDIGTADHKEHPAVFPVSLADRIINLLTFEGDIVLDPFCGSGTTCISAAKNNRQYIGIDISENYCRIARIAIDDIERQCSLWGNGQF